MRRILFGLMGVFMALGLTFVGTPASATTAASDDVGILAVVGTFNPSGIAVLNNQVCTPVPANTVSFTFNEPLAGNLDQRVAFFEAGDPTCADADAQTFIATGSTTPIPIPADTAFYSST